MADVSCDSSIKPFDYTARVAAVVYNQGEQGMVDVSVEVTQGGNTFIQSTGGFQLDGGERRRVEFEFDEVTALGGDIHCYGTVRVVP